MLLAATAIFLYYTAWTLLMVCSFKDGYFRIILFDLLLIHVNNSPLLTRATLSMTSSLRASGLSASL